MTHPHPSAGAHLGERVSALADGELSHEARDRALAHVAVCSRCRADLDAERQVRRMLRGASEPVAPTSLLARLQALPAELPALDGPSVAATPRGWDADPALRRPRRAARASTTAPSRSAGRSSVRATRRRPVAPVPPPPTAPRPMTADTRPVGAPAAPRGSRRSGHATRARHLRMAATGALSLVAVMLGAAVALGGDGGAGAPPSLDAPAGATIGIPQTTTVGTPAGARAARYVQPAGGSQVVASFVDVSDPALDAHVGPDPLWTAPPAPPVTAAPILATTGATR